ncbi:hypothetical protein RB597_003608 [Gaeumannomyces tritici]
MDSRPHRPLRLGMAAANGNENAAPLKQALHQRHKSTGQIKNSTSLIPGGGLKLAPKRAAFGEVNTNVRAVGLELNSKKAPMQTINSGKENSGSGAVGKKNTILQQPAQRLKIHGSTVNQTSVTHAADVYPTRQSMIPESHHPITRKPHVEAQAPQAVKAVATKKASFVYDDSRQLAQARATDARPATAVDEAAAQIKPEMAVKNPRQYKSQPHLRTEQPALRRTVSRQLGEVRELPIVEQHEVPDTPYEDALEELIEANEACGGASISASVDIDVRTELIGRKMEAAPAATVAFESEDNWDEEDVELDEDQGYTTAHSFKSHGDNTTQGLAVLLAPKVTVRIREELELARIAVEESRTFDEIEEEQWDVSMVAEYGDEIFSYMRELETRMAPDAHYMDIQTEIQWSMRSVLIDWVIQVHHRFSLLPETLFLSVNYIDRFLSQKVVSVAKLQLVGATALFIAAKYEEINCPSVNEIIFMVDNGFSADEILKAERFMLSMLQFELGWPGPMSFLRRISKADDYDLETRTLAKYFLEVTIMDERFVSCPPSYLAAGAHCLSRMILRKGDWSQAHTHWAGYTWSQIRPLVKLMLECCHNPEKHHQAVYEKYLDRRYKGASAYVQEQIDYGFTLPQQGQPALPETPTTPDDLLSHSPFPSLEMNRLMAIATSQA